MSTRSGERTSPPAASGPPAAPATQARRRAIKLSQPVPDLVRSALILSLRALGNPNRFRVWDALRKGEATVSELAERLPMSQQTVSAALGELQRARLVEHAAIGSRAYRLTDAAAEHALALLQVSIERHAIKFARELHGAPSSDEPGGRS